MPPDVYLELARQTNSATWSKILTTTRFEQGSGGGGALLEAEADVMEVEEDSVALAPALQAAEAAPQAAAAPAAAAAVAAGVVYSLSQRRLATALRRGRGS
jgi:hypothetical protein